MAITLDGVASPTADAMSAAQPWLPKSMPNLGRQVGVAATTGTIERWEKLINPGPGDYDPYFGNGPAAIVPEP